MERLRPEAKGLRDLGVQGWANGGMGIEASVWGRWGTGVGGCRGLVAGLELESQCAVCCWAVPEP